jgi:regulator of cell morphogenesis and NO signaling
MNYKEQGTINPDKITIGEIVANNYNTAGVFRRHGMDFCCGGGITLQKACEKRNVDLKEVMKDLEAINTGSASANENFKAWEPGYLIDHIIQTHHKFVRNKIEEIAAYAEKVARVHGQNHPENVQIYQKFISLGSELMEHLIAEEEVAFPLIKSLAESRALGEELRLDEVENLKEQLELMVDDHDGAGRLMEEIRELSNQFNPPSYACATYRILYQNLEGFEEDLHKHVHLENNILFKKAEKLIGVRM